MATHPEELQLVRRCLVGMMKGAARMPSWARWSSRRRPWRTSLRSSEAADFMSLGNDLTASTLGLARTDPRLVAARAADPAVLRLVDRVVRTAGSADREVSVCGDAAADPLVLPLLLGAGVRTFSVVPTRIDAVRSLVRADHCRAQFLAALDTHSVSGRVSSAVGGGPDA